MSVERKSAGLRVALASYDVQQLRVWHRYLAEQSDELLCSDFCSGEELLQVLRHENRIDVVVLGGQLEDMDDIAFLERMTRLPHKPLILLQNDGRPDHAAFNRLTGSGLAGSGPNSLRELMLALLTSAASARTDPDRAIRALFESWGVPQPDINCEYLLEAAAVAGASQDKLAIRKEILQRVAERHHISVAAVDSGLRRLIDSLETRNTAAWNEFKQESHLEGKKITTGKLIYAFRARILSERATL